MTCPAIMVKRKWTFFFATDPRKRHFPCFPIRPLRLTYRRSLVMARLLFVPEPCRQKFIAEEVRLHRRTSEGSRVVP